MRDVSSYIDYTLLRADAVAAEVDALCGVAVEAAFAAVCVNGVWVERASSLLAGTAVLVATVVGFPLGADPVSVKTRQTRDLVERGADEIDMVISLGHLLDGDTDYVADEIRNVVAAAERPAGEDNPRDGGTQSRADRRWCKSRSRRGGAVCKNFNWDACQRGCHRRGGDVVGQSCQSGHGCKSVRRYQEL